MISLLHGWGWGYAPSVLLSYFSVELLRLVDVQADADARRARNVHVAFGGGDERGLAGLGVTERLREINGDRERGLTDGHFDVLHGSLRLFCWCCVCICV